MMAWTKGLVGRRETEGKSLEAAAVCASDELSSSPLCRQFVGIHRREMQDDSRCVRCLISLRRSEAVPREIVVARTAAAGEITFPCRVDVELCWANQSKA